MLFNKQCQTVVFGIASNSYLKQNIFYFYTPTPTQIPQGKTDTMIDQ